MKPKQSETPIAFADPAKRTLTDTEMALMRKIFPTFGFINVIDAKGRIFLTGGRSTKSDFAVICYYTTEGQLKYARRFK